MQPFQIQDMFMLMLCLVLIGVFFAALLIATSKTLRTIRHKKSAASVFGVEKSLDLLRDQNIYLHRRICEADDNITVLEQDIRKLTDKLHLALNGEKNER
jgi:hypothetical protein